MAIAIAQNTGKVVVGPVDTAGVSFPSLPAAGSTIIVLLGIYGETAPVTAGMCTDNQGNTYQIAVQQSGTSPEYSVIWYAENIGTPSGTFTITLNTPGTDDYYSWAALAVTGLATTASLDRTQGQLGSGTDTRTGVTAATTQADELLLAVMTRGGIGTMYVVTPGWTEVFEEENGQSWEAAAGASQIVAATGAYECAWANAANLNWGACIATFKAAAVGPAPITRTLGPVAIPLALPTVARVMGGISRPLPPVAIPLLVPALTVIQGAPPGGGLAFVYTPAKAALGRAELNPLAQDWRVILVGTNSTCESQQDAEWVSDLTTLDEYTGAGYSRVSLSSVTVTRDDAGNRGWIDAANAAWPGLGAGVRPISNAILYVHAGADSANRLIGCFGRGGASPLNGNGGTFTLTWQDAQGLLRIA
jgi:hypothetical protein